MESVSLGNGREGSAEGDRSKWVESSLSSINGNCVEVADLAGREIGVRDSRPLKSRCSVSIQVRPVQE